MKIGVQDAVGFRPITVSITLESQSELDDFYAMGENWYRTNGADSPREKMGVAIMDLIEDLRTA